MKAKIEITLKPFIVPNYVVTSGNRLRGDEICEDRKFHLKELDPVTLEKLCDDFKKEVFKKAEKPPPPQERNCDCCP